MHDVIVVGAGISGLLSALALSKEGKNVLVLEKENYVGGVCRSYNVEGYQVDTGPHIITRLQTGPLGQMINQYFDMVPNFTPHGQYYVRLNQQVKPFPWNLKGWFQFDPIPQMDRLYLMKLLFSMSHLYTTGDDVSRKSVGEVVGDGVSDSTKRFIDCLSYFLTGASMNETPVARFLDSEQYKTQSSGYIDKLYKVLMGEGAQDQCYPKGGVQSIINSIMVSLPAGGVKTAQDVVHIEHGSKIRVHTKYSTYQCKTLIFSGPAKDLPRLAGGLPKEYTEKLGKIEQAKSLTIWLGLNKRVFERDGSEIWVDTDPYTWAVPVSNYDPALAPKGKQLVGFAFRTKTKNPRTEEKQALEAIFAGIPEIEKHIEMKHVQHLIPEKAAWTTNGQFASIKTPLDGVYLVGTDTVKKSMGITRAAYSVQDLLAALRQDGRL